MPFDLKLTNGLEKRFKERQFDCIHGKKVAAISLYTPVQRVSF